MLLASHSLLGFTLAAQLGLSLRLFLAQELRLLGLDLDLGNLRQAHILRGSFDSRCNCFHINLYIFKSPWSS